MRLDDLAMQTRTLHCVRMTESAITLRGQTTLPKAVRQALGLKPGDRLRYVILDDGEVRLLRRGSVHDLAGMLHDPERTVAVSLEEMDEGVAGGVADRNEAL